MARPQILYNALIEMAASKAEDAVLSTLNVYLSIGGIAGAIVIGIIGFIGYSQLRDIRVNVLAGIKRELETELRNSPEFRRSIKVEVESDISADIAKDIRRLERLISISQLNALTDRISEEGSFSSQDADSAIKTLLDLKDEPEITASPNFTRALRLATRAFYSAGLWEATERIDAQLSGEIIKDPLSAIVMMENYGMRCLGEQALIEADQKHVTERMLFYIQNLLRLNLPEVANQYLLAYELWTTGRSERSDRIIASLGAMTPDERLAFVRALLKGSDAGAMMKDGVPRAEQIAFAQKYRAVYDTYKGEIDRLVGHDAAGG